MKLRYQSISAFLFALLLTSPSFSEDKSGKNLPTKNSQELTALGQGIQSLFINEDFIGVIDLIDQYFKTHSATEDNVGALLAKAQAYLQLDKKEPAIGSFERALPVINKLNNVAQRRYSQVYFSLGHLYSQLGMHSRAVSYVKDGLRLESQNIYNQIFLGELYKRSKKNSLALSHYQSLLELATTTEEERVVIGKKLDQISQGKKIEFQNIDLTHELLYKKVGYKLVPINHFGSQINLKDICILLMSKFLVPCEVLPPIELNEKIIWNTQRNQYDGNKIHKELLNLFPEPRTRPFFVIGVTDKDIFAKNTNYVFSWQDRGWKIGVVSTFRFIAGLDDFYELDIIPTRRLGIQFLSTVGSLHKFSRPITPNCPLAYPNDFAEFLNKSSQLCDSTISQRNSSLRKNGGLGRRFTSQEEKEINRVYSKYHFR